MSSNTRNIFMMIAGLVVGYLVLRWILHLALSLIFSLLPIALVAGGLYVAYLAFGRKALSGGRRTLP